MNNHIYHIRNLKHFYNTHPALAIENLSVSQGAVIGLTGPNGSGKSTLLKLLSFIERPTEGEILFKGEPAEPFSDAVRFRVTLLTQTPYLMKRSVFKNIAYGLRIRGGRDNHRDRIFEALEMVGLSEGFAERHWYELSGGEAQRVALAARLALRPEVLLLDEPTASVDAASMQLIRDASVQARREWGATLIIASHDREWLYEVSDEVLQLFRGRPAGSGDESVLLGPWHPRDDGLWEKPLHDGQRILAALKPPGKDAAGIIASNQMTIEIPGDGETSQAVCLNGTISRLILERRTRLIIAAVLVGNVPVTAKFTRAQVRDMGLYPGQKVRMYYDPDSIKWL